MSLVYVEYCCRRPRARPSLPLQPCDVSGVYSCWCARCMPRTEKRFWFEADAKHVSSADKCVYVRTHDEHQLNIGWGPTQATRRFRIDADGWVGVHYRDNVYFGDRGGTRAICVSRIDADTEECPVCMDAANAHVSACCHTAMGCSACQRGQCLTCGSDECAVLNVNADLAAWLRRIAKKPPMRRNLYVVPDNDDDDWCVIDGCGGAGANGRRRHYVVCDCCPTPSPDSIVHVRAQSCHHWLHVLCNGAHARASTDCILCARPHTVQFIVSRACSDETSSDETSSDETSSDSGGGGASGGSGK